MNVHHARKTDAHHHVQSRTTRICPMGLPTNILFYNGPSGLKE
jgi:hypothetical protein